MSLGSINSGSLRLTGREAVTALRWARAPGIPVTHAPVLDKPRTDRPHRDVLRWLQSLDLAYSVRSVRRDFANGFLVAEILSRYYSVPLHAFDNGSTLAVKKDNWDQVRRRCFCGRSLS